MDAEVTAEKGPACNSAQYMYTQASSMTYKYKGRVQILVVFVHELPVVLLCPLPETPVELRAKICLV